MEGLPFLPGSGFADPTRTKFNRAHTLGYTNGYALQKRPQFGIGGTALPTNQISQSELDELGNFNPQLTYGQAKQAPPSDFIPGYVAWDKKVLRFKGWFKETVHESPLENHRVRLVDMFYYLEDDSIAVVEPRVENSGLPQGKLIKRQRLPKNDVGDCWNWKDLNIGMDIGFYGRVFHIYDCDKWSRDWLESEGIEVNEPEGHPDDPYIKSREQTEVLKTAKTKSDFDKLKQFLEMDRKVLRFYCIWDDRDQMFGEVRKFILHYYLVNDTMEIREIHTANDGHDPFPILISRQKIPKDRSDVPPTFQHAILELSDKEIKDYFTPKDFDIGQMVTIYNRRFFLYDCDNFTKAFYWKNFGKTDFTPASFDGLRQRNPKMEIPPYTGYGTLEDSMQSCQTLIPQPPRKDIVKLLENDGVTLRFEAILDSMKQEDKGRRFILAYRLADDMVTIYEPPVRNSGVIGGKFLEKTRIAKPGSNPEKPIFYGPQDFYIGAAIDVFRHRFIVTNADAFVLNYMEQHPSQFSEEAIESLREKISSSGPRIHPSKDGRIRTIRTGAPGEIQDLVQEVKGQLKKLAITANIRKDRVFLGVDISRNGFIRKADLKDMCIKHHLPCDDDVVDSIAQDIGKDPDRITLEELRSFFENT